MTPIHDVTVVGIGFVNFGHIDSLDVQAPIVTTGKGARGFNLYDGSLRDARFESIGTTGDVTTTGGEGLSLVKSVQITLQAAALSIKQAGSVGSLHIGGRLATAGSIVTTLEVEGQVNHCSVAGGIVATGEGSDAVHVASGGTIDLDGVQLTAEHGEALLRT